MDKKNARLKRSAKTRLAIRSIGVDRLTIYRTSKHIYAQIINNDGSKVLACANTLQTDIQATITKTGNINAAGAVGTAIAKKAILAGIVRVAFDRSGYKYHGRVKALADAAREAGLSF